MVRSTENSNTIYPLAPQSRGKRVLGQNPVKPDPNLKSRRAMVGLKALHGDGNVITVDSKEAAKDLNLNLIGLIGKMSSSDTSPILAVNPAPTTSSTSITSTIKNISNVPSISGTISLVPPTNISISNEVAALSSNGSSAISASLNFDSSPGAVDYEVQIVTGQQIFDENVIVTSKTSSNGVITIAWSPIPNANNYVFTLKNNSGAILEQSVVYPTYVGGTVSFINLSYSTKSSYSSGTYTFVIDSYNSQGLAAGQKIDVITI